MNVVWSSIVADFKNGVIDFEEMLGKLWATVETFERGLPSLINNLLSTDAALLIQDAKQDLQQIVTNIQNNTTGLTGSIFAPLFQAAVLELPIIEQQGLKILESDWTLIIAYYAANNGITSKPANNGVVS